MSEQKIERPEEMAAFFDERAKGYDRHMEETIISFEDYYNLVSQPINKTGSPIEILDLGCGTGLELKSILDKAPNARITCLDLSSGMIELLLEKYKEYREQLTVINDSYVTYPFEVKKYDYVVSVMTMHHFLYDEKLRIYNKIYAALKKGGVYIEGDYVVSSEDEACCIDEYNKILSELGEEKTKLYHIDIPFSLENQKKLFRDADLNGFNIIFEEGEHYIYTVEKDKP